MDDQKAPKWYGIATFSVEDLLFALGSMIIANAAMSSATFGMFAGNSETNGAFIGAIIKSGGIFSLLVILSATFFELAVFEQRIQRRLQNSVINLF